MIFRFPKLSNHISSRNIIIRSGFSLLEVIIAIGLLGFGVAGGVVGSVAARSEQVESLRECPWIDRDRVVRDPESRVACRSRSA